MNKLQEKIVEWGEALLAPFVLFLYRAQIGALAREVHSIAAEQSMHVRIWWHYSLPGRVRPLLVPVFLTVALSWLAGSLVYWYMHLPDAGIITYMCWTAWSALLALGTLYEYWNLGRVTPISRADLEQLETDTANMSDADARALRERRFGPMRVLGVRAFGLVILGYLLVAIGLALMGSFSNLEGNPWPVTAQFILFAILASFVSLFMAMLTAVALGTAARVVGSIVVGLFKGGWDSILTMLPNVEGEEAKELLPKDLDKQLAQTWKLFKDFLVSAPGVLLLGVFALGIVWHHPLIVAFLLLAFIGLMSTTTFSIAMGNDEAPARKRAGKIVAWAFTAGFLYRCAEMWYFGLPGGTWYWNYDSVDAPLARLWNGVVPWWNGLTQMSWWQAGLVIMVTGIGIFYLLKLPDGKWMQRVKYSLVGACSVLIAVVVIGFIANRASVDTAIDPVAVASEDAAAPVTAETERAPDSIDRLMGTGEAETPTPTTTTVATGALPTLPVTTSLPPIPGVPPQHVEAVRSTERASGDRCEAIRSASGLTDLFREAQLRRLGC